MVAYASSLGGLLLILAAHLFYRRILSEPRSAALLLNISAGIAMAYAFVDVFPHLARKQSALESLDLGPFATYLTHHVYLVALFGFCVYVVLRVFKAAEVDRAHSRLAYRGLVLTMCLYALFIGYMLAEQPLFRPEPALLFGLAMGAHFLGLNHSLSEETKIHHGSTIRFLLVVCTTVGWLTGFFYTISATVYALAFAYIAGGIVAVGAISDLPRVRAGRDLLGFLVGAGSYSIVLLLLEALRAP